jgi:translocation and assembly module TamA
MPGSGTQLVFQGHYCCSRAALRVALLLLCLLAIVARSEVLPEHVSHRYDIAILGASDQQTRQIRTHLARLALHNFDDMETRVSAIEKRTKRSLQAIGYYQPQLNIKYSTYKQFTAIQLFVDIGKPVIIEEVALNITGEADENLEFQRAIGKLPIYPGAVLNHGDYESAKDQIYSNARNLGFFDARFERTQVLVESKDYRARIFIDFDSGKRHTISQVHYNTDLFEPKFLQKWQSFDSGVPYRATYAARLTRNLQNSGYFKHVSVRPEYEGTDLREIPLVVDLVPASENIMSLGAGYATDTELRVKGSWLRPHHNTSGHAMQGTSSLSRTRQEASLSYQIPHRRQPEHGRYSIETGLLNEQKEDTFSQLRTVNFNDSRLVADGWYRDLFVRLENENTEDRNERTNLLLPGISFSRTQSSGGIHPDHGNFLSFRLLGGSNRFFSDIDVLRFTASAKKLFSFNQKHYFIARADLGFLQTSDFDRLAPSHRFYTGGDNSVRGFEFQSISPANESNESAGGRYLTNFSVEYNRYFRGRWAIAAFADTGRAFNDPDDPYRVGIGAGLRWLSPVGPLRVDVAVGISEEERPVRMHLAIGPQL